MKLLNEKNNQSTIYIGQKLFEIVDKKLGEYKRVILIADKKMEKVVRKNFNFDDIIFLEVNEKLKNIENYIFLLKKLIKMRVDRNSYILSIGGGVLSDLVGFVASTYMRGVKFSFIPTTLLSQVDASIGGKNGININGFKNLAGTFNCPEYIFVDLSFLNTLDIKNFRSGIAEIIKYGIINDIKFFEYLYENSDEILKKSEENIEYIIYKSIQIKNSVVKKDKKEKNLRKILNFGHTIGHAIELEKKLPHGFSVSIGMVYAAKISQFLDFTCKKTVERIVSLLEKYGLPTEVDIDNGVMLENILKDKKKNGDYIDFIFIDKIGSPVIKEIKIKELSEIIKSLG
ncbi:MAG TPA: 3-dehydroquinate synthase [Candidatus Mcinerneyibacterium sp.]|nr:3-dehydroquinate synthase [Candidatus Mcinerneyibacterium sp.]